MDNLTVYPLGQVGYVLEWPAGRIAIDPYLTDSVAETYGEALRRRSVPTLGPAAMTEISWVLLTHAHLDHTDPASLRSIAQTSPAARFLCPYECEAILLDCGVAPERLTRVRGQAVQALGDLVITPVPAAHTKIERNEAGDLRYVGYLLSWPDLTLYHAGDTMPDEAIFASLAGQTVGYAFLPVNERNYFRDAMGIVGNMSVREAFQFAVRIGARVLVPTHWDTFAPNGTLPAEVEVLYRDTVWPFELRFLPCGAAHELRSAQ